jgi:hypothetical protein
MLDPNSRIARPGLCLVILLFASFVFGTDSNPKITPLVRVVDLSIGETLTVKLSDGSSAIVELKSLEERRDSLRDAIREARVEVVVNGKAVSLVSANYQLPKTVGGVRIDCSITCGYVGNSGRDSWGLKKDARLRLWPAGSPLMRPGTFGYPLRQRWFASGTQMANEPTFVDGGERPKNKKIYYHNDLDFGGAEGMIDVLAATDGLVVSFAGETLPKFAQSPARKRYDVIYLLDDRGWFYRYSHLHSMDSKIELGQRVRRGQRLGFLGKEGGSGGWAHLHFGIVMKQPSGEWGTHEAYALAWEAYLNDHQPKILAVARPHRLARVGENVTLDGSKSWSGSGKIESFKWTFTDGAGATGKSIERSYSKPGMYSEILEVKDAAGQIAYDFAVVQVIGDEGDENLPPSIQAAYAPTFGIRAGDPVTFKTRTFRTTHGSEVWDFGEGSPKVTVKSDGNAKKLAIDGFAVIEHAYARPGHYLARVERSNEMGHTAVAHLHVEVGPAR